LGLRDVAEHLEEEVARLMDEGRPVSPFEQADLHAPVREDPDLATRRVRLLEQPENRLPRAGYEPSASVLRRRIGDRWRTTTVTFAPFGTVGNSARASRRPICRARLSKAGFCASSLVGGEPLVCFFEGLRDSIACS